MDAYAESFDVAAHAAHLRGTRPWGRYVPLGLLGCALSHLSAWREVAAMAQPAMICEDDVLLAGDAAALARTLEVAASRDVAFANDRVCPSAHLAGRELLHLLHQAGCDFIPVGLAVTCQLAGPSWTAPGSDCYALSPAGARKLVAIVAEVGIVMGNDWLTLRHAAPRDADAYCIPDPEQPFAKMLAGGHGLSAVSLRGAAMLQPFARHRPGAVGGSVIRDGAGRHLYVDAHSGSIVKRERD